MLGGRDGGRLLEELMGVRFALKNLSERSGNDGKYCA